ncbi:hypothetical protein [Veronia pacifica]|uniref:Uncharacterized protein n=1 Tax=Veronia pacifica TaxID=1080227 RepID=A0A1C3EGB2_9GAMM|nr:hypothetical protein [Veronia pacifica]ODA32254.1 hypothetical protein A8L45_13765 [Veronia pacifica]
MQQVTNNIAIYTALTTKKLVKKLYLKLSHLWVKNENQLLILELKRRIDDDAFLEDVGLSRARVEAEIERLEAQRRR